MLIFKNLFVVMHWNENLSPKPKLKIMKRLAKKVMKKTFFFFQFFIYFANFFTIA